MDSENEEMKDNRFGERDKDMSIIAFAISLALIAAVLVFITV